MDVQCIWLGLVGIEPPYAVIGKQNHPSNPHTTDSNGSKVNEKYKIWPFWTCYFWFRNTDLVRITIKNIGIIHGWQNFAQYTRMHRYKKTETANFYYSPNKTQHFENSLNVQWPNNIIELVKPVVFLYIFHSNGKRHVEYILLSARYNTDALHERNEMEWWVCLPCSLPMARIYAVFFNNACLSVLLSVKNESLHQSSI